MGQGVSLTALSAGSAGIDVEKLSDLTYEKSLGAARFMKCVRARHQHGLVVVKVVVKPYPDFDLNPFIKAIRHERNLLADVPNALGFQRILKTDTSGYLVRQYLYSSLYDRMSTRPFLEDIEKKWLAYQMLCALRDCHSRNVYHGDIKTENVLVTSWNWLYLTDFSSSYKKTYLPEDNPADFSYFFDTSGRRTCYIAPERFLGAGEKEDTRGVTWAMDVFSVGCVIAELFLEAPIFSLSQLFKYRKGEYDPELGHLSKIEDKDIRELVTHMIQVEPESRYSAEEYLNFWRRKAFPEYFYSFLHQYMGLITDPSSGHSPVIPETDNFGDADERIDRVYYDFDKISYFLDYDNDKVSGAYPETSNEVSGDILPVHIEIPNNRHLATSAGRTLVDDGTLIFLTMVVSSLRNTARSTARLHACDLMLAFGERITDEAKLDRVLPYAVALLSDRADVVKIAALRTLTQLLSLINVVSPVNAYVFTEYIRPRLQNMTQGNGSKMKPAVRVTYAACLATLAHTSARILDMVQALRADGSIPTVDPEAEDGVATDSAYQNLFDVARSDLVEHFESHTKALLTDNDASVRRAFLGSVSSLCIFFGSSKSNDVVLSHLNTYLNDKDWTLKCSFFQTIVGVATFVGGSSLEDFILPLMVQALTDPEEFVVEKVLSSFASLAELGLFQRSKTWEMVDVVARFMVHPNIWIKQAAVRFVSSATRFLSIADIYCTIMPLVRPYMKTSIQDFSEKTILDALKRPLPRAVVELTSTWATKVERGIFWKTVQQQRTFSFGGPDQATPTISSKDLGPNALRKITKNEEDEQWLTRLRNLGMGQDDEFKLLALRDYIGRTALKRSQDVASSMPSNLNGLIMLEDFNVTRQTIFFEVKRKKSQRHTPHTKMQSDLPSKAPHSIADALLDASTTIDGSLTHHKKSYVHGRKERVNVNFPPLSLPTLNSRNSSNLPSPLSSSPVTRDGSVDPPLVSESRRAPRLPQNLGDKVDRNSGALTPADSIRTGSLRDKSPSVRHKPSAINLLNRTETSKSSPETGTTTTNVSGKMDAPVIQETEVEISDTSKWRSKRNISSTSKLGIRHSYEGNDPNVIKILDDLALEIYPFDLIEYGPRVTPVSKTRHLRKSELQDADIPWRPQGVLVATFGEHTGPINRVLPSPDHLFFITASDDGSVKVWDTLRLERNLVHRSRHTHRHRESSKVKCVTFVSDTHTFVSCATDGSVNIVKVECTSTGEASRYGKLQLLQEHQLPAGEYAVWAEHFKLDAKSLLILATNTSRIVAIDIRTMTVIYSFENRVHHGTPTCFVLDRRQNWLLLGTSHGVLDLWDLRFRLHVKAFGLHGGFPVYSLQFHPWKGRGRWVCVAGGTGNSEITLWDIEKEQCREVYRAYSRVNSVKEDLKFYELWKVDDERPEAISNRFSTAIRPVSDRNGDGVNSSIRALAIGLDSPDDGRETKYGFLLTGGPDRKIRFWDLARVEGSAVVNGLDVDEGRSKFVASHPTANLVLNVEQQPPNVVPGAATWKREANSAAKRSNVRPPRTTVISKQQQQLLRSHLDVILDIVFLEYPVGMSVSVDRAGVIYVFQ